MVKENGVGTEERVALIEGEGGDCNLPPDLEQHLHDVESMLGSHVAALDYMIQGLCLFDSRQRVVICNRRYAEIYRLSEDQVSPGTTLERICRYRIENGLCGKDDPEAYIREWTSSTIEGSERTQTLSDGRTILIRRSPVLGGGWVSTHEDVTARRTAEAKIAYLSSHDDLTGLPNRAKFIERLDNVLKFVRRGEKAALLYFNIDHFKRLNDTFGHTIGDRLLREVVRRVLDTIRETDTFSRLSGDEFAVLQTQVSDERDCAALAQRLISVISNPYCIEGHALSIGVTIGIYVCSKAEDDPKSLLRGADLALSRAKNKCRGAYLFFEEEMNTRLQNRSQTEADMRAAIVREEFEIFYQPILDVKKMAVTCLEALVRWRHPKRGLVMPCEFITVAEDTSLILPLGEWVLRKACFDAQKWTEPLRVSVNFSVAQFTHGDPVGSIEKAISLSGLEPARLEVEVTESLFIEEPDEVISKLRRIKELGVRISMDDFGTGYSSLKYLNLFPFDKIKIDRSFVKDLPQDCRSLSIVKSIACLGHNMGFATTMEGVETEQQLEIAVKEGCNEVQGYFFSRPVPALEMMSIVENCNSKAFDFTRSKTNFSI